MAQKSQFKLIQGPAHAIGQEITIQGNQGWKPILMSTVATGTGVHLYVILETVLGS